MEKKLTLVLLSLLLLLMVSVQATCSSDDDDNDDTLDDDAAVDDAADDDGDDDAIDDDVIDDDATDDDAVDDDSADDDASTCDEDEYGQCTDGLSEEYDLCDYWCTDVAYDLCLYYQCEAECAIEYRQAQIDCANQADCPELLPRFECMVDCNQQWIECLKPLAWCGEARAIWCGLRATECYLQNCAD